MKKGILDEKKKEEKPKKKREEGFPDGDKIIIKAASKTKKRRRIGVFGGDMTGARWRGEGRHSLPKTLRVPEDANEEGNLSTLHQYTRIVRVCAFRTSDVCVSVFSFRFSPFVSSVRVVSLSNAAVRSCFSTRSFRCTSFLALFCSSTSGSSSAGDPSFSRTRLHPLPSLKTRLIAPV